MQNNNRSNILPPGISSFTFPKLLYVSNVDEQEWTDIIRVEHSHNHLEVGFLRHGQATFMVNNHLYDMKPGDVWVNNVNVLHDEQYDRRPVKIYALGIDNIALQYLPSNCLLPDNVSPIVHCGEQYELLDNICGYLYNSLDKDDFTIDSPAYYALLTFLSVVVENSKTVNDEERHDTAQQQLCNKVRDYINEHYLGELSLLDISEAMNVSPYYMSRAFKKSTGFSPMQYAARLRIGKAQVLLIHTDMNILNIAYETGYNNLSTFNYAFSKLIGMTPDKFRKTYRTYMSQY